MHISKKSEYAILGSLYLANQSQNRFVKITEVVQKNRIPKSLLLKIFNKLVRADILESKMGSNGGFRLKKEPKNITLLDILRLFETSPYVNDCASENLCDQIEKCSMGVVWRNIQKDIDEILKNTTFDQLVNNATKHANLIPLNRT